MLSTIESVNNVVNNFIWGVPAMICIIGVGLLLSFRTRFLQICKFPYAMKVTIGRMLRKRDASDGALTPFQAVCTALAATVGTGNIAGVAGAIAIGGPGAVFWMWISAILGMCTKFSEVTLAVHFREKNADGDLVGGPMYYIKNGLKKNWHWLAYLFAAFGVLTVFGTGNATQVNTITTAIDSALINYGVIEAGKSGTLNLIIGIVLAALIALILLGGIKRIGRVTEKLVPFMAVVYILLALVEEEACILHLAPTTSTTAQIAMGDALAVSLMQMRGFTSVDFARLHPGGSLGRRLLMTVGNVMRDHDLPVVAPDCPAAEMIHAISKGGLGLIVICEGERIEGIVTDGDVRRAMERLRGEFFNIRASDIATRNPKTISPDEKLIEAEKMMTRNKVTSLLVTDAVGKLTGVIQIYDIKL